MNGNAIDSARRTALALALAGASALGGCAAAPPAPEYARTDAVDTLHVAEELGADETPAAAHQLEIARSELEAADRLIRRGNMDGAREILARAKADARLAIALRREDRARRFVTRTHESIDQLRDAQLGTSGGALPAAPVMPRADEPSPTESPALPAGASP